MSFSEERFKQQVKGAIQQITTVLDAERNGNPPVHLSESYGHTFACTEIMINISIAALLNALALLGVTEAIAKKMRKWARRRSVTLRMTARQSDCTFSHKTKQKVKTKVTEKSHKYVKIKEYFWWFETTYELHLFRGNRPEKPISLLTRTCHSMIKSAVKVPPRRAWIAEPLDVNITILFATERNASGSAFAIDLAAATCRTARRNVQVEAFFSFAASLIAWTEKMQRFFDDDWFALQAHRSPALLCSYICRQSTTPSDPTFRFCDLLFVKEQLLRDSGARVLGYQRESLKNLLPDLSARYPDQEAVLAEKEARLVIIARHLQDICQHLRKGLDYIEATLYECLIDALGKEVKASDFTRFQLFYNQKLFLEQYRPRPFHYPIRRAGYATEGLLSVEQTDALADPIHTFVRQIHSDRTIKFALDAATQVSVHGKQYLHGFLRHTFEWDGARYHVTARTKLVRSTTAVLMPHKHSACILLLGKITGADQFEPTHALLLQNQSEVQIPLSVEAIPSAKEFRDVIESLSSPQQRFAKMYRTMQIESTLFGVCVIQVKPQLEKLLNLDSDSLTREVTLTQDILQLFIKHQIPPDQLCFTGKSSEAAEAKIEFVRANVQHIHAMIQREIDAIEAEKRRQMEIAAAKQRIEKLEQAIEEMYKHKILYKIVPSMATSITYLRELMAEIGDVTMEELWPEMRACMLLLLEFRILLGRTADALEIRCYDAIDCQRRRRCVEQKMRGELALPELPEPKPRLKPELSFATAKDLIDYTRIPFQMEARMDQYGSGAVRPTIISVSGDYYYKRDRDTPSQRWTWWSNSERREVFDLLDLLTRSGIIGFDHSDFHVLVTATHRYDLSLMNTVMQRNVNPIEEVERSSVIVASIVHAKAPAELTDEAQQLRITRMYPTLYQM